MVDLSTITPLVGSKTGLDIGVYVIGSTDIKIFQEFGFSEL
jgi:hypothetical protein